MTCIHDSKDKHIGVICRGVNSRYIVRTRQRGFRLYDVKSHHRSYAAALKAMTREFTKGRCKRAEILLVADYYDPVQLCELVRRE